MRRYGWLLSVAGWVSLLTGCVDRRFVVTSDPPGAIVMRDHQPIGAAPADDHFVYYGKYHFTLIKDGYQTLQVDQPIPPPWYEYIGLDFFAENIWPWMIEDVRRFHYSLEPLPAVRSDQLLEDSEKLRDRARTIHPVDMANPN